ncbi:MAG: biotin--[acetyl-CoA-carboxylase] ligase [Deltaproteobacteria bacterium]|nr:biotin--[acetyl-CoA-carboxylase] ligase [Deltaproteobacteria bacterium]
MNQGLFIIGTDFAEGCESVSPDSVGDRSVSWEKSIRGFGPWEPVLLNGPGGTTRLKAWRSMCYSGPETVFICGECTSTMDVVKKMTSLGLLKAWDSVISVFQTAGRGQHGRTWESLGGNLFSSWLWPPFDKSLDPAGRWANMASLLAGGAIADFLATIGVSVEIKWPNDLLYHGKKLCGILVEDFSGLLVTGIGINIKSAPGENSFYGRGAIPATSLLAAGKTFSPLELWLDILSAGKSFYSHMTRHAGPDFFIKWLEARLAWKGARVVIRELPEGEIAARISGLAPDGGLEISRNGQAETLYNGRIFQVD